MLAHTKLQDVDIVSPVCLIYQGLTILVTHLIMSTRTTNGNYLKYFSQAAQSQRRE